MPSEPAAVTSAQTPTVQPGYERCNLAPYTLTANASQLLQPLRLGLGTLTLLGTFGLRADNGELVHAAQLVAEAVPLAKLEPVPTNWEAMTCGLRATVLDRDGRSIDYLPRGLLACLLIPDGAPSTTLRLAYFDSRPALNRWVFLSTRKAGSLACSPRFRQAVTFALFRPVAP